MTALVWEETNAVPHLIKNRYGLGQTSGSGQDAVSMFHPPLSLTRTIKPGQMTESSNLKTLES